MRSCRIVDSCWWWWRCKSFRLCKSGESLRAVQDWKGPKRATEVLRSSGGTTNMVRGTGAAYFLVLDSFKKHTAMVSMSTSAALV